MSLVRGEKGSKDEIIVQASVEQLWLRKAFNVQSGLGHWYWVETSVSQPDLKLVVVKCTLYLGSRRLVIVG